MKNLDAGFWEKSQNDLSVSLVHHLSQVIVSPDHRRDEYVPYGACRELQSLKTPELVISGPAGTGKSRACLEKIHRLAERYSGSRFLIVRKTRASLTESALQTYEDWVLGQEHPMLFDAPQRRFRQNYQYPNGSEIIVGGLDKPSRIMSTEYDLIFVQEAIELEEEDWDALGTRLRNNIVPFQQLVADTNPSFPSHWLYKRCQTDATQLLASTHQDNPRLWDHDAEDWTKEGQAYLARLDQLSGIRRARFRYGKWEADDPKALWSRDIIDHVTEHPDLTRIVVGIDPASTTGTTGIIVAGLSYIQNTQHLYILDDVTPTAGAKPAEWGRAAVAAYHKWKADRILGEANHGGDMIENVIRNVPGGANVAYKKVNASRGKKIRAEPVSALYESGRAHHVGKFPELEDEYCNWVPDETKWSPNRLDAAVWCGTELIDLNDWLMS